MYTKENIEENLKQLEIEPTDTLMVHTSLKKVGKLENGADTVLDALCETLRSGLLVLPGHTWSTIDAQHPLFDVKKSPVCVGVMPEVFRKRSGVFRSLHPTHSLLAYGRDAEEFTSGDEKFDTPCAPDSGYGKMEKRNGKVMMIGVNFRNCTLVHCIEEVGHVPGRLTETMEPLKTRKADGTIISVPQHRHHNANSDNFEKLEPVLKQKGVLTYGKIGSADTIVCSVRDLFRITLELLKKDPKLFDDDKPIPENWYK